MSIPQWFGRLIQKRTVQLLMLTALLSTCAYSVVTSPSPFVVNAYYGEAYYNNALSSTTLAELISSGATKNLTHLTYAFAQINGSNPCAGLPVAMNLTDLQNLKAQNPQVKVLISIGGEGSDALFENAIKSYGSATAFAQACVPELMNASLGSAKANQYVNGIDIDWEYPTASDEQDYTAVIEAFQSELGTYASNNGTGALLLTAAIGPEQSPYGWQYIDLNTVKNYVAFFNVEYYNYAYNDSSLTESNAPLKNYGYGDIPDDVSALETTGGVPANQIVMGIPFYGVHWTNVTASGCSLGAAGTMDNPNTSYTAAPPYYYIASQITAASFYSCSGSNVVTDGQGSAWSWDDSSPFDWYEYDNPTTIAQKISYAETAKIGGIFAWNLQDDTTTGTLLNAMVGPVTGPTNVTGSVSITSTGLFYNRFTKQGSETVTVKNTSGAAISGPIELVLSGLSAGVTAANNTGTFNGNPYWAVSAGSMNSGGSVSLTVAFGYANGTAVTATPTVYSGSLQ